MFVRFFDALHNSCSDINRVCPNIAHLSSDILNSLAEEFQSKVLSLACEQTPTPQSPTKPDLQAIIPIQKVPHLNFWGDTVSLNIITATTHSKKIRDASLRDLLTHASATKEFALIKRGKTFVVDPSLLKDLERDEITTQISPSEFT